MDIILKKDMAERIVTRITGVKGISNQLQVIVAEAWVNPSVNDGGRHRPGLMTWNLEVGNKTFLICVNRENGTITIRGVVEDPEQKDRAEHILKLRAPGNFQIINEIEVSHNNVSPTSPPRRTIIY